MKLREPYSTILYIVFGVLLAFGINGGLALALSTDLPIVAVESNSMNTNNPPPFPGKPGSFAKGDILVLRGVWGYEVGDVIVFTHTEGTTPVVHRLIQINQDGTYQTKGDANTNQLPFEKRILPEQVHGKVTLIVPHLGWIKIGMTEFILPNVMWLAGIIIFLYIIGVGITKLWRD